MKISPLPCLPIMQASFFKLPTEIFHFKWQHIDTDSTYTDYNSASLQPVCCPKSLDLGGISAFAQTTTVTRLHQQQPHCIFMSSNSFLALFWECMVKKNCAKGATGITRTENKTVKIIRRNDTCVIAVKWPCFSTCLSSVYRHHWSRSRLIRNQKWLYFARCTMYKGIWPGNSATEQ